MISYFLELQTALTLAILFSCLGWMYCHRSLYIWKEYAIIILMLVSVSIRFIVGMAPPPSHFMGITLINIIFISVSLLTTTRPKTLLQHYKRANECKLF